VAGATVIRRWCLFLASCDYDIRFRSNGDRADYDGLSRLPCAEGRGEHTCCDGLSRLPCAEGPSSSGSTNRLDVFALSQIQGEPVETKQVAIRRSAEDLHASRLSIVKTKRLARSQFQMIVLCLIIAARVIKHCTIIKANADSPRVSKCV